MAAVAEIEDFLNGVLVAWLESCLPQPEILTGYSALLDGQLIHSVWLQIDAKPPNNLIDITHLTNAALYLGRVKNFESIIRNVKSLFEEAFHEIILVLPDSFTLGFYPETKSGLEQMKMLLTLFLGAAVQCPSKELFIAKIKELNVDTQHAIVEIIKQVTDTNSLVLTVDSIDELSSSALYNLILQLTKERDNIYAKWISAFYTDSNSNSQPALLSQCSNLAIPISDASSETNQMAVELADLKMKLRKLRQELEEKAESHLELQEELEHKAELYEKLKLESQEWHLQAKRATAYRDEVDILRERAERADRLEVEIEKLKGKLMDAEFYKSRVEELKEDNQMMLETKEVLEEQLQKARKRCDHLMALETDIVEYKQKLNDLTLERNANRSKLAELLEENTQLQLAAKRFDSVQNVNNHFSEDDSNSGDNSLSEQLENNAQTRVLKLELENKRLAALLNQAKERDTAHNESLLLQQKQELSLKNEEMKKNLLKLTDQINELKNSLQKVLHENEKMQHSIKAKQDATERFNPEQTQVKVNKLKKSIEALNEEQQRLHFLIDELQRQVKDSSNLLPHSKQNMKKLLDKADELKKTKEQFMTLNAMLKTFEQENNCLKKEIIELKEKQKNETTEQLMELDNLQQLTTETDGTKLAKKTPAVISENFDKTQAETISESGNRLEPNDLPAIQTTNNDNSKAIMDVVFDELSRGSQNYKTVREVFLNISKAYGNIKTDMCVLCQRKEIFTVEKSIQLLNDLNESMTEQQTLLQPLNNCVETDLDADSDNKLQPKNPKLCFEVASLESQLNLLNTNYMALQLASSQLAAEKEELLKRMAVNKQENENMNDDKSMNIQNHSELLDETGTGADAGEKRKMLSLLVRNMPNNTQEMRKSDSCQLQPVKSKSDEVSLLRSEHAKLADDFRNLFTQNERFKTEYKSIQEQYKIVRLENTNLKHEKSKISQELKRTSEYCTFLKNEHLKVVQHCEMLFQLNADLDIDRKTLMENISQLLSQYHELLSHSLDDKQHFHKEEKSYTERVHNLNRQKEKLEEKIMEHYKKTETAIPKKKAFASNFVRRVKKASSEFMNKVPSRSQNSSFEISQPAISQVTIGFESGGNESDNSADEHIGFGPTENVSLVHQNLQRFEPPDVSGSSFNTAGSRRTVYLIDEKQKLLQTEACYSTEEIPNKDDYAGKTNLVEGANKISPLSKSLDSKTDNSTIVVFNRINTSLNNSSERIPKPISTTSTTTELLNQNQLDKRVEEKTNSVWYEYGCV